MGYGKYFGLSAVPGFALWLSLLTAPAYAESRYLDFSGSGFNEQVEKIKLDLAGGDTYADMQPAERDAVVRLLDSISRRVAHVQDPMQLSPSARTALFNEQEQVNSLLSQAADDSRQICRRERPTGTRRSITVCTTAGEVRRNREETRDNMSRMTRAPEDPLTGRGPNE